jgi:hypothetical protein
VRKKLAVLHDPSGFRLAGRTFIQNHRYGHQTRAVKKRDNKLERPQRQVNQISFLKKLDLKTDGALNPFSYIYLFFITWEVHYRFVSSLEATHLMNCLIIIPSYIFRMISFFLNEYYHRRKQE